RGIDCKWHDDPDVYRKVVDFLKQDAMSLGALVTTHKLDLLKAARDRFEWLDPYAEQLGEVSSISKREGQLRGHAKDPISSGLSFEAVTTEDWAQAGADVCLLGAGGSSLALTIYLMNLPKERRPSRILVTNRSEPRLDEMKAVHADMDCTIPVDYFLCPAPDLNDRVVAQLKPGSLVINATGLGKDAPGSPVTDAVTFPVQGIAWDFNYRGNLVFLDQARVQQAARGLRIEDGWVYFVHGWRCVMEEVFNLTIPASGPEFDRLCDIAAEARQ
ncbi:MAG: shikimate dehydrogenase, partial [Phycisphaerae bacterium]|nr:shikimate dehydrogenase [Phycisphaerae bacterium]